MNNTDAARMFKAFSDERRLEILEKLQTGEKCASELMEDMYMGQSTLSHHMKILCDCGLVNDRKEGKWHHYSINADVWKEFSEFISVIGKGK